MLWYSNRTDFVSNEMRLRHIDPFHATGACFSEKFADGLQSLVHLGNRVIFGPTRLLLPTVLRTVTVLDSLLFDIFVLCRMSLTNGIQDIRETVKLVRFPRRTLIQI